jgi:hypothetical protein
MNTPQKQEVAPPAAQNAENGANAVEGCAHIFALAKKRVFMSPLRGKALSGIVV